MRKVLKILSSAEKSKLILFLALICFASLLESIGIGIIPIFLFFISNPQNYIQNIPFDNLKFFFINLDKDKQILYSLILIALFFTLKNLFLFFLLLFETKFKKNIKIKIGERLMKHYLSMNYIFHTKNNPIILARNIGSEVNNICTYILSLVLLFKEILLISMILTILFLVDVESSIYTLILFLFLVGVFFYYSKNKIKFHSNISLIERGQKGKILYQTFSSIKDVIINNRFSSLLFQYLKSIDREFSSLRVIEIITKLPKLIIEIIIIFIFCLFFLNFFLSGNDLLLFFPILSLYALAGIRLYPCFNNVSLFYNSLNTHRVSLNLIHKELSRDNFYKIDDDNKEEEISFNKNIRLENLSFEYDQGNKIIDNISLEITYKKQHAFIGESGSGKSTIINILMCLLDPTQGKVLVDNVDITKSNWLCSTKYLFN